MEDAAMPAGTWTAEDEMRATREAEEAAWRLIEAHGFLIQAKRGWESACRRLNEALFPAIEYDGCPDVPYVVGGHLIIRDGSGYEVRSVHVVPDPPDETGGRSDIAGEGEPY